MHLQRKLVEWLSVPEKTFRKQIYFSQFEKSFDYKKFQCTSVFGFNNLIIDCIDPSLPQHTKNKLLTKQSFLIDFVNDFRFGRLENIFKRVRKCLSEQNLYPEIALVTAIAYEHLEFFDRSKFWIKLL